MNKLLLALLLTSSILHAAENLKFSGTLIERPACTVNHEETIEIPFGDVAIDKIDGSNYLEIIGLYIYCDGPNTDNVFMETITFGGTATDFNPAAIDTDVKGLGIEIRQNGTPLAIGDVLKFREINLPLLQAVPVKKNGASLQEGSFEAWATIKVEYQ